MSLLWRLGCASRADLAKAGGISQPTAGKIINELLSLGILHEVGSGRGPQTRTETRAAENGSRPRLGRPGQMLRLDNRRTRFLAVELGVTETSLSALPVGVELRDQWARSFPTPATPEAWRREFDRVAAELVTGPLWGILISVPGIVDEAQGKVLFSPNLHWLEQANLPELANARLKAPVLLVQEIRALALGHLSAEPEGDDFFLVDFGQGVGGAMVIDGQLYSHPTPLSGEFGHTPVANNPRRCGCGAVGCLETLVSERGLLESFAQAHGQPARSIDQLVEHVAARGMEPWLLDTLNATAQVISGALNVLGLHRVVVTGLLTQLPSFAFAHLADQIQRGAMWARFGQVICQSAPRRRAAGLVAVGLDRLVFPNGEDATRTRAPSRSGRAARKRLAKRTA
jgi:predicted NBD/HSP70 family sugar kinase